MPSPQNSLVCTSPIAPFHKTSKVTIFLFFPVLKKERGTYRFWTLEKIYLKLSSNPHIQAASPGRCVAHALRPLCRTLTSPNRFLDGMSFNTCLGVAGPVQALILHINFAPFRAPLVKVSLVQNSGFYRWALSLVQNRAENT